MLKKMFRPKIIKNYKSSKSSINGDGGKHRKNAKSVNTYNNMSRNDANETIRQCAEILSLDFKYKINEDNTAESQMHMTTAPKRANKYKIN